MHKANSIFWKYVSQEFPTYFNENILEFGSYNINGTIKDFFKNYKKYVGIDWRSGPDVDVVGLAHVVKFDFQVKAVLSASMLEHDPYWEKSLENMINHLQPNGILVLTWGAARNPQHCLVEAPDGNFHCLKVETVINYLRNKNLFIHTSIYEGDLIKIIKDKNDINQLGKSGCFVSAGGWGEYNLIAFNKDFTGIFDKGFFSTILKEDKI